MSKTSLSEKPTAMWFSRDVWFTSEKRKRMCVDLCDVVRRRVEMLMKMSDGLLPLVPFLCIIGFRLQTRSENEA